MFEQVCQRRGGVDRLRVQVHELKRSEHVAQRFHATRQPQQSVRCLPSLVRVALMFHRRSFMTLGVPLALLIVFRSQIREMPRADSGHVPQSVHTLSIICPVGDNGLLYAGGRLVSWQEEGHCVQGDK